MEFDTKQQPKPKKKKERAQRKIVDVGHSAVPFDTANYCSCLERVKDYSKIKDLVVTFVEVKDEELPEPLYDTKGLEWQIWRKDYGEVVKYYWYNHLLDKKVRVLENGLEAVPKGFTRLYRGVPRGYLPKNAPANPAPKKAKAFLTKIPKQNSEVEQNAKSQ